MALKELIVKRPQGICIYFVNLSIIDVKGQMHSYLVFKLDCLLSIHFTKVE